MVRRMKRRGRGQAWQAVDNRLSSILVLAGSKGQVEGELKSLQNIYFDNIYKEQKNDLNAYHA